MHRVMLKTHQKDETEENDNIMSNPSCFTMSYYNTRNETMICSINKD